MTKFLSLLLLICPTWAFATTYAPVHEQIISQQMDRALVEAIATPRVVFETQHMELPQDMEAMLMPFSEWWGIPISFGALAHALDSADVVLVGEHHEDPATHRLELDISAAMHDNHEHDYYGHMLNIAMEMFERDQQDLLDDRFNDCGEDNEEDEELEETFLQAARLWSNYQRDYRPITEQWRQSCSSQVVASNAPTSISRRVAKEGIEAVLASLTTEERGWIAESTTAPRDDYWQRFLTAMGGGASADAHSSGMSEDTLYRYYQAQCLKDDTMAETIAALREADPQRQVVHLSGSFHIDYGLGIVPRLKQRRPDDKIVTVAIRPVENFEETTLQAALEAEPGVADYVVFVLKETVESGQ
ncbi:MAG: ChaN family lipoprotein [bacterium]|nr:ChaN family lipoprotein [bacterium]